MPPKAAVDVEQLITQATMAHAAETAAMQAKLDQQEEAARVQAAAVAAMMAKLEELTSTAPAAPAAMQTISRARLPARGFDLKNGGPTPTTYAGLSNTRVHSTRATAWARQ